MKGQVFVSRWSTSKFFSWIVILLSATQAMTLKAEDYRSPKANLVAVKDADSLQHATTLSVAFRNATEAIRPAVVSIRADQEGDCGILPAKPFLPDAWQHYLDEVLSQVDAFHKTRNAVTDPKPIPRPSATGVIVSPEGYVVTSYDVVAGANQFIVKTHKNIEYPAKVARKDLKAGLAILKIDTPQPDLEAARLADFDQARIGDWVLAIGGASENMVSAGIISAITKNVGDGTQSTVVHTDALISPANHGGPLVNLRGEIVGINMCKGTEPIASRAFGVAVPCTQAQRMLEDLVPVRAIASRKSDKQQSWSGAQIACWNPAGYFKNLTGLDKFEWKSDIRDLTTQFETLVTEYSRRAGLYGSSSNVQPGGGPIRVSVQFSPEFNRNRISEKSGN